MVKQTIIYIAKKKIKIKKKQEECNNLKERIKKLEKVITHQRGIMKIRKVKLNTICNSYELSRKTIDQLIDNEIKKIEDENKKFDKFEKKLNNIINSTEEFLSENKEDPDELLKLFDSKPVIENLNYDFKYNQDIQNNNQTSCKDLWDKQRHNDVNYDKNQRNSYPLQYNSNQFSNVNNSSNCYKNNIIFANSKSILPMIVNKHIAELAMITASKMIKQKMDFLEKINFMNENIDKNKKTSKNKHI